MSIKKGEAFVKGNKLVRKLTTVVGPVTEIVRGSMDHFSSLCYVRLGVYLLDITIHLVSFTSELDLYCVRKNSHVR